LTMVASILEELDVDDHVRRGIMGGTLEGILAGDLPDLSPPAAPAEGRHRCRPASTRGATTAGSWTCRSDCTTGSTPGS